MKLAIAAAIALATIASPAAADTDQINHRVDDGYDAAITVDCAAGYNANVPENTTAGRGWF